MRKDNHEGPRSRLPVCVAFVPSSMETWHQVTSVVQVNTAETTQQDDATNDARIIAAEEAVMASAKNMTANSASPSSSEAPRHKMAPAHQGSGILLQGKGVYGEAPISSSEGNSILWTARQWRCYFCLGLVTGPQSHRCYPQ